MTRILLSACGVITEVPIPWCDPGCTASEIKNNTRVAGWRNITGEWSGWFWVNGNVIVVGLFSNFKSFMIFDLCLEILERKARGKLEEFLVLSFREIEIKFNSR